MKDKIKAMLLLDKEVYKKIKIYAIQNEKTISQVLEEYVMEILKIKEKNKNERN